MNIVLCALLVGGASTPASAQGFGALGDALQEMQDLGSEPTPPARPLPAKRSRQPTSPAFTENEGPEAAQEFSREQIVEILDGLQTLKQSIDLDRYDIEATAKHFNGDPNRLLEFVSRETRLIPYRGALRDAHGVMVDRHGNSLDRALLLRALLESSGYKTRLANSTLSRATAELLWNEVQRTIVTSVASDQKISASDIVELVRNTGFPIIAREIQQRIERLHNSQKSTIQLALEESERLYAAASPSLIDSREKQIEELSDHWWVQVVTSSGVDDYDPTFTGRGTESEPLRADRTYNDLPEEMRHRLVMHLDLEFSSDDGSNVKSERVITYMGTPSSHLFEPTTLVVFPDGFDESELSRNARVSDFRFRDWGAAVVIEGKIVASEFFGVDGRIGERVGTDSSGFGDLGNAMFGNPSIPASALRRMILRFELLRPGARPMQGARVLFDYSDLTQSERASKSMAEFPGFALTTRMNVFATPVRTPSDLAISRYIDRLESAQSALFIGEQRDAIEAASTLMPLPLMIFDSLRWRSGAQSDFVQLGNLAVTAWRTSVRANYSVDAALDIMTTGTIALNGNPDALLRLSVYQSFAESLIAPHINSAAARLAESAGQNVPRKVIKNFADIEYLSPFLIREALTSFEKRMTEFGTIAVVPLQHDTGAEAKFSWWDISKSGEAIARNSYGEGEGEYIVLLGKKVKEAQIFAGYAFALSCLVTVDVVLVRDLVSGTGTQVSPGMIPACILGAPLASFAPAWPAALGGISAAVWNW